MTTTLQRVTLTKLFESPLNPRQDFGDIDGLAATIEQQDLIEPIVVRPRAEGGFWIVAGARRSRALRKLGRRDTEVIVREMADAEALQVMLIENKDRESLNALELAGGYARLQADFGLSLDEVGKRVGVPRSTIYWHTALLKLPEVVRGAVAKGKFPAASAFELTKLQGERLRLQVFAKAEKLPTSKAVRRLVDQYTGKAKRGATRHQRAEKLAGEDAVLRARVVEQLPARIAERVEHKRLLDDTDLRFAVLGLAEVLGEPARLVFQRRGLRPDRLSKVGRTQLNGTLVELIAAAWLSLDGEKKYSPSVRVALKTYGFSAGELEKTVQATTAAEALFKEE